MGVTCLVIALTFTAVARLLPTLARPSGCARRCRLPCCRHTCRWQLRQPPLQLRHGKVKVKLGRGILRTVRGHFGLFMLRAALLSGFIRASLHQSGSRYIPARRCSAHCDDHREVSTKLKRHSLRLPESCESCGPELYTLNPQNLRLAGPRCPHGALRPPTVPCIFSVPKSEQKCSGLVLGLQRLPPARFHLKASRNTLALNPKHETRSCRPLSPRS